MRQDRTHQYCLLVHLCKSGIRQSNRDRPCGNPLATESTSHRINKSSRPLPAPNLRAECTRVNKTKDMLHARDGIHDAEIGDKGMRGRRKPKVKVELSSISQTEAKPCPGPYIADGSRHP